MQISRDELNSREENPEMALHETVGLRPKIQQRLQKAGDAIGLLRKTAGHNGACPRKRLCGL